MLSKQLALLLLMVVAHVIASPMSNNGTVPDSPAVSEPEEEEENAHLHDKDIVPNQKWIIPLISFGLAPASTTPRSPPGPQPQMVIMPQGSTLSVVAQQPINLVQGPPATTYTANAPGPNPITVTTG